MDDEPASIVGSDRVTLAVAVVPDRGGIVRLGAAVHDEGDSGVGLVSVATTDADLPWALELIKTQCAPGGPSSIIAARSASADFLAMLGEPLSGEDLFPVITRPARGFNEQAAMRGLLDARILELEPDATDRSRADKAAALASAVDTNDVAAMRALGGLLEFLSGTSQGGAASGRPRSSGCASTKRAITLSCVREFSLSQTLAMDTATALALGVMSRDRVGEPSGPASSLHALLDRTTSVAGGRILRQWLLRPSTDIDLLEKRLDAVAEAKAKLRTHGADVSRARKEMGSSLRDVGSLLRAVAAARAKPTTWLHLHSSAAALITVGELCNKMRARDSHSAAEGGSRFGAHASAAPATPPAGSNPTPSSFLGAIADTVKDTEAVVKLFRLLDRVFEFEGLSQADIRDISASRLVPIRDGVDSTLDELRALQEQVPARLEASLADIASEFPELSGAALEFIPQLGHLVAVDVQEADGAPGWVPAGFEAVFTTEERSYYRCAQSQELDQSLGDVHSLLHEREHAVLRSVEGHVLELQAELGLVVEAVGELDVIFALAETAQDCGLVRPTLTREAVIDVVESRHPLAEMTMRDTDEFIPNDFALGGPHQPVAVLSGPNGSGKSVLIKQLGLIVVMAHIGSFVPARRATIGIVDRLFSKIRARDTPLDSHGAFTYDAARMTRMLKYSTPHSLLLVDEFGKGTASTDGAALLAASIRHVIARSVADGTRPPRAMVITHFREVLDPAVLATAGADSDDSVDWQAQLRAGLRMLRMDVLVDGGGSDAASATSSVRPLFRVVEGTSEGSYGLACASAAGLPDAVVRRAGVVVSRMSLGRAILPVPPAGRPAGTALAFLAALPREGAVLTAEQRTMLTAACMG